MSEDHAPAAPRYYAVDRCDGKRLDLCATRHDAVGRITHYQNADWYTVIPVSNSQALVRLPRREQPGVVGGLVNWEERHA